MTEDRDADPIGDVRQMSRQEAEEIVRGALYGAPGEPHFTQTGLDLLLALLGGMGLSALTDEAVLRLAALHLQEYGTAAQPDPAQPGA